MFVAAAKDQNANQEPNPKNVSNARVKERLISDKDQCKFKWAVLLVMEKDMSMFLLVKLVMELEWLIKLELNKLTFQLE